MDREAWQATVHSVVKEWDMTGDWESEEVGVALSALFQTRGKSK